MASPSISLLFISLINFSVGTQIPRALAWSSNTYGPDGPWYAITVQIGTPPQTIDLFPGGFWQSDILSSSICDGVQTCYATAAGLYNSSVSTGVTTLSTTGVVENSTFADEGMLSLFGSGAYVFDTASIATADPPSAAVVYPNFDMLVISEGFETLPDGTKYPIEVGNLALGAPNVNQSWNDGGMQFNGSLVPSYLYITDQVPSNSFGMHIGSTALEIPPSLYIGGYDQTRVLGEVTVQDYNMHYFPIDLLDIGIGVAEGASPFSFSSKPGLLASGNSSVGVALQVIVDPIAPFLYLPQSTCDAITADLPVHYQPNLGLYFWDTSDEMYEQIISSPAFLSFTFRLNSSITQNMSINVPFSLLNLTLAPPLVSTPTPYFPCTSFDYGKSYGLYTLGKAFLQAAFLGVNWQLDGNGVWFLAQAPGPNTPTQATVVEIGLDDDFITPSDNVWADTWTDTWMPIAGPAAANSTSSSSGSSASGGGGGVSGSLSPGRLSRGAVAGIAVGAAAVLIAAFSVSGGLLLWRRRRAERRLITLDSPVQQHRPAEMAASLRRPRELADEQVKLRMELDGSRQEAELPG